MLLTVRARLVYDFPDPCEALLMIEAARGPDQDVQEESLIVTPAGGLVRLDDDAGPERRVAFLAHGRVQIDYSARVAVARPTPPLAGLPQPSIRALPPHVLRHLRPSRYCPSDRLERFVAREFGELAGGDRVMAILAWIQAHMDYEVGVSDAATDALESFVDRAGVCRDFAHLAIALCRAGDIPARAVSAYAWRLEPPDLHVVVEVFLDGAWRLVDATGRAPVEALVRVATGRDVADVAFLSIFGEARMAAQAFSVAADGGG